MWSLNADGPFKAEHLKSLMEFTSRQKADTLNITKAIESIMEKMELQRVGAANRLWMKP